jgi:hypothetical protein
MTQCVNDERRRNSEQDLTTVSPRQEPMLQRRRLLSLSSCRCSYHPAHVAAVEHRCHPRAPSVDSSKPTICECAARSLSETTAPCSPRFLTELHMRADAPPPTSKEQNKRGHTFFRLVPATTIQRPQTVRTLQTLRTYFT